jgi:SchA/CurD like domain
VSNWFALLYKLKPGSEETVAELFRNSGRPDHTVRDDDGNEIGQLITTMAFVGSENAVRVIEIEGDFQAVAAHMSRQPETQEFERGIQEHLSEPRNLSTPEGAVAFFKKRGMQNVLLRRSED